MSASAQRSGEMAASQACAALIGVLAIWPSLAAPTCKANQFQVSDIVFNCEGSAGSVDTNQIKVNIPTLSEITVATIPKGIPNFQAQLRGQHDADLFIKDATTGESIYSVLPGGENGLGSSTRSGVYGSLSFDVTQTVGLPTLESVIFSGHADKPLELVIRNNGNEGMVELGFSYGPWSSSSGSCRFKTQPQGCLPYNQNAVETSGLAFSSWLSTAYGTCNEAWTQLAVPQTGVAGGAVGVPYHNWGKLYQSWPSESRPDVGLPHMEKAMFKFVSNGGLEDNKNLVRRSDFAWICGLKQMSDLWMQPCCAKLRTAFTDESAAWLRLGQIAETNGHRDPQQGIWEVCRSLPHAPLGGRADLLHLLNSDSRHVAGPSDIKFCWPNGPVQVKPTTEPLAHQYVHHISQPELAAPGASKPWEDDGTGRVLPPQAAQPAIHAQPASTIAPTMASGTTPKPRPMNGTTLKPRPMNGTRPSNRTGSTTQDPYVAAYHAGGTTPYPTITDPPYTAPPSGLDIARHTTEFPRGVTMQPEIIDDVPISSTGPSWQGIAIATGVGVGVAGAAIGTAAGIHAAVVSKDNQGQSGQYVTGPTQGGVYARRGSMGSGATTQQDGTGQGIFPVLLLLGVFCSFLLCVGVVGVLLYCINRRRKETMDREMYLPHQGMGVYPEDQENLLQHHHFPQPMYAQPQAMHVAQMSGLQ